MEFKLNKIDTDIRIKIQEEIKEDKVHSGKAINVNKDLKNGKENSFKKSKESNLQKKRCITIDGIKDYVETLTVEVEKTENMDEQNSKGTILDKKK